MNNATDAALRRLEQLLSRDPLLGDVIARTLPRTARGQGGSFVPDIDVVELDDRFVILVDVPGVPRESLNVELDGPKLVIEGTKAARHPVGGHGKVTERAVGTFRREFLLPAIVDGNAVTARLADGVLRVEVPRALTAKTVQVQVGQ